MAYKQIGWKDYPDKTTPMNAQNLKHMEDGIVANDAAIGDVSKISGIDDGTLAGAVTAQNKALATLNKQYIQCGAVTCTYYTPYFLKAIVTLPIAYSRAIAGFVSKATNTADASAHVSCLLDGNNKITVFVENENGIFTPSSKQVVYWMTVGAL